MRWPSLLLPFLTIAATAQNNSAAKHGTGIVTGHVYCADTNAPARMASVQLEPAKAHSHFSGDTPAGGVAQTGFDGAFTLSNVPPGSYYVVVAKAGYLSPRAYAEDVDNAEPQPAAAQPPIVIPRVDVQADQTASVEIRLERGAAISGTVRFDDGSPASDVMVMLLQRSKDKWVGSNDGLGASSERFRSTPMILATIASAGSEIATTWSRSCSPTRTWRRGAGAESDVRRRSGPLLRIYSGDTPSHQRCSPHQTWRRRGAQRRRHHHPAQ